MHILNLLLRVVLSLTIILVGSTCQLAVATCLCIEYTLNRVTAMMQMPTILHAAGVATRPIGLWYQE